MGFQSSFNQALGTIAGAALGAKHIKGQKESLKEQKMQGKFNLEREINREQEQNEVANSNLQNGTAYIDKNEMMAERAGQALASEVNSKKHHYVMVDPDQRLIKHYEGWIKQYMDWYGVSEKEATKAYNENSMRKRELLNKEEEKKYREAYNIGGKK